MADSAQKAGWLMLTDVHNSTTTAYTFLANTSHYFLTEIRPTTSSAATAVSTLTGLHAGSVGFTFVDSGTTYTIINNPTVNALPYIAGPGTVTMSVAESRATWLDPGGSGPSPAPPTPAAFPPYSHIVVTQ